MVWVVPQPANTWCFCVLIKFYLRELTQGSPCVTTLNFIFYFFVCMYMYIASSICILLLYMYVYAYLLLWK